MVCGCSWARGRARSCCRRTARAEDWEISGPHFAGWEIYHLKGSPADPDRLYASQSGGWFGQLIQRSRRRRPHVERRWATSSATKATPAPISSTTARSRPWKFTRVWHLEPSLHDPDTVYAGVEDAALFRSIDGGGSWQELPGLRGHGTGPSWQPGAGGMCLHSILLDPRDAGAHVRSRSRPRARSAPTTAARPGEPINRGLRSEGIPDPDAEVGHCVHHIALHPSRPDALFMQKHWDVMRSDDGGEHWREISGDLPTDFGFVIDVHAHEPETIYVVPITSDSQHFPLDGKLRVYRSRTGGDEWEPLTQGLPQEHCYVNVLRDAMAVDSLDDVRRLLRHHRRPGVRLAGRGRHVGADRPRPAGRAVGGGADAAVTTTPRVVLPAHLRSSVAWSGEVVLAVDGPVTQRSVLDALELRHPALRGTIREHGTLRRRPFVRFFACERDLSHELPDDPLPDAVATGVEPLLVVGAMAGG